MLTPPPVPARLLPEAARKSCPWRGIVLWRWTIRREPAPADWSRPGGCQGPGDSGPEVDAARIGKINGLLAPSRSHLRNSHGRCGAYHSAGLFACLILAEVCLEHYSYVQHAHG